MFRYGSVRMPIEMWGPWRDEENQEEGQLHHVRASVASMLKPEVVLDILQNFTLFATDKKHRRIKIIGRYQQYFTTNQIVDRVVKGYPKKGLSVDELSALAGRMPADIQGIIKQQPTQMPELLREASGLTPEQLKKVIASMRRAKEKDQ